MSQLISNLKIGYKYFNNQKFNIALKYSQSALKINANNIDALALYGMCCFYLKDYNKSKIVFSNLKKRKNNISFESFYFRSLLNLNEYEKANEELGKKDNNNQEIIILKIKVLSYLGERKKLINLAHLLEDNVQRFQYLSWNYEQLNNIKESKLYSKKLMKIDHSNFYSNMVLAKIYLRTLQFKKVKRHINNINKNSLSNTNTSLYYNLKAQLYEKLNRYKKAYKSYSKSNQYLKKIQLNNLKTSNNYYTIEAIAKYEEYFNNKPHFSEQLKTKQPVVFMVGYPRSGTTLLENILNAHSNIETIEERPTIDFLLNKFLKNNSLSKLEKLTKTEINRLHDEYFDNRSKFVRTNNKLIIDKLPLNIIHIGLLFRIFPNAKFIINKRQIKDVALSCYFQSFQLNEAMSYFLDWGETKRYLNKIMPLSMKLIKQYPIDYKIIKYERLVTSHIKTIKETIKFLGLEWEGAILEYRSKIAKRNVNTPSYAKIAEKISGSQLKKWKRYKGVVDFNGL